MSLKHELAELNNIYQAQQGHVERLEALLIEARELLAITKFTLIDKHSMTLELIEAWEQQVQMVIGEGK
jgi:hypothetical protein